MKTAHVYYTSALIRDEQFTFHKAATGLVDDVHRRQAAGKGSGADDFSETYDEVAKAFLDVWAKAVGSIGGVSLGLTNTANNYAAADWHSRGIQGPPLAGTPRSASARSCTVRWPPSNGPAPATARTPPSGPELVNCPTY